MPPEVAAFIAKMREHGFQVSAPTPRVEGHDGRVEVCHSMEARGRLFVERRMYSWSTIQSLGTWFVDEEARGLHERMALATSAKADA